MKKSFFHLGLLGSIAVSFIANPACAQSEQIIRFDGGRSDRPRAITTDAAGSIYIGGSVESLQNPIGFAVVKHNAQGSVQWMARYAGQGNQVAGFALSVATDAAGNVYAAGTISRQIDFLTHNADWLVVSFAPNGAQRWAHVLNGQAGGADQALKLVLDPSGALYVTGYSEVGNDVDWLTIKYSLNGAVQWQRTETGAFNGFARPVSAKLDPSGNLVVVGQTLNTSAGLIDVSLVKYDSQGNIVWRQIFADDANSEDAVADLALDPAGNIYITGLVVPFGNPEGEHIPFLLKYDANGVPQYLIKNEAAGGASVVVGPDGNIAVAGTAMGAVGSAIYPAVSKYSPLGVLLWSTPLDTTGNTFIDGKLGVAADGSVFYGGFQVVPTGRDFFAVRFSATGGELWRRIFPDGSSATDAHLSASGDFFLTGESEGLRPDMLTIRFSSGFVPPSPAAPAAPTGLSLTAAKGKLTLQWTDNSSNESGFMIERAINGGAFTQIAQVGTNVRSFVNTGLNKVNTYAYRVRAFNSTGSSAYSNTASGKPK